MDWLDAFYHAKWQVTADQAIYWRGIVGKGFRLGSALFRLGRSGGGWPVGIVGNVLLFTVFMGQAVGNDQGTPLYGQASRQVFFLLASVYGWWRWQRNRHVGAGKAVTPHWASARQRVVFLSAAAVAVL